MSTKEEAPAPEDEWADDELTEEEWRQFVAHSLADELEDPRQDIYENQAIEPF